MSDFVTRIYHSFVCLDCGEFVQGDEASRMINRCTTCLHVIENNILQSSQTDAAGNK